jgi:polar amino acid transport system substrate-binding protein
MAMTLDTFKTRWVDYAFSMVPLLIFALAMLSGLPRLGHDDAIRIAAALLPPKMDSKGDGQEAEIIVAALVAGGEKRSIEFHVMPFTRHWQVFETDNRFDAVTTVPDELTLDGLRSEPYIDYQNGVFYDVAAFPNGLGGDPLKALAGKRIVAFAGAATILPGMRDVSDKSSEYLERKDQLSHSVMFAKGAVDAVVADELIFAFYTREFLGADYFRVAATTVFDPVFCPTAYHLMFRGELLRNAFNKGLAIIRSDGTLGKITAKYATGAGLTRLSRQNKRC